MIKYHLLIDERSTISLFTNKLKDASTIRFFGLSKNYSEATNNLPNIYLSDIVVVSENLGIQFLDNFSHLFVTNSTTSSHACKVVKLVLTKDEVKELVIAYEPIWAIGTGRTATADVADETCGFIRKVISKLYDEETGAAIRIQYGGSVKVNNIEELMSKPNIDGALIGGASLVAEDFIYFANVASKLK